MRSTLKTLIDCSWVAHKNVARVQDHHPLIMASSHLNLEEALNVMTLTGGAVQLKA